MNVCIYNPLSMEVILTIYPSERNIAYGDTLN